jgi:hypothetical protein
MDRRWRDLSPMAQLMAALMARGVEFSLKGDLVHVRVLGTRTLRRSEYDRLRARKREVVALLQSVAGGTSNPQ